MRVTRALKGTASARSETVAKAYRFMSSDITTSRPRKQCAGPVGDPAPRGAIIRQSAPVSGFGPCAGDRRRPGGLMSRVIRCSLIQASNAAPPDASLEITKKAMIDKHVSYIRQAAEAGAQVVCLQEIFYGPYFCAEQTARWYDFTEPIPGGPTIRLMQDLA